MIMDTVKGFGSSCCATKEVLYSKTLIAWHIWVQSIKNSAKDKTTFSIQSPSFVQKCYNKKNLSKAILMEGYRILYRLETIYTCEKILFQVGGEFRKTNLFIF